MIVHRNEHSVGVRVYKTVHIEQSQFKIPTDY